MNWVCFSFAAGKGAMAEVSTIISVVEQHLHVLTEESQQKTDITK